MKYKLFELRSLICCYLFSLPISLTYAQQEQPIDYVNPFIGTADANVYTKWGKEGGTYPGAVAPWGYLQLSPETLGADQHGYHYQDTLLHYFSCLGHMSGFPKGSTGKLFVMPLKGDSLKPRPFRHQEEEARPGYYRVRLHDDGTLIETTTRVSTGLFRITFPPYSEANVWLGDVGTLQWQSSTLATGTLHGAAFLFEQAPIAVNSLAKGIRLSFGNAGPQGKVVTFLLSSATSGSAGALRNITKLKEKINNPLSDCFDIVRQQTEHDWQQVLERIHINDPNEENKRIFYTALYHACLLPWIVSDAEGYYRGADGAIHQNLNGQQYGAFSPWDTFRSLHPLIQLVWPEKQADMVYSMLSIYKQTGYLPTESMTGNHAVPILVDSYLKNPSAFKADSIYQALLGSIQHAPFKQADMTSYQQIGYVPASLAESVTRTLEYAYDDWALSRFAREVMQDELVARVAEKRSKAFQQLFHTDSLLLLPRSESRWYLNPGNFGYKEGDPKIYSYFVPQAPRELISLMGGDSLFSSRLNSFMAKDLLVFDNEPAFHVPYLFSYANRADLTQSWVHRYRSARFSNNPGGLPGNDDLGSLSSWYVFSALGFYPFAPGTPHYTLGLPLFKEATIQLSNEKKIHIRRSSSAPRAFYVQAFKLNNQPYLGPEIAHHQLTKGAELHFHLDTLPGKLTPEELRTNKQDLFKINTIPLTKKSVFPNEPFQVFVQLENRGMKATKVIQVRENGKTLSQKNMLMDKGEKRQDTLSLRLYTFGTHQLQVADTCISIDVIPPPHANQNDFILIDSVSGVQLLSKHENLPIAYRVKNTWGEMQSLQVPVRIGGKPFAFDSLRLYPGEQQIIKHRIPGLQKGTHYLQIGSSPKFSFFVYGDPSDALLLGGWQWKVKNDHVYDQSFFKSPGLLSRADMFEESTQTFILDEESFVRWEDDQASQSLDKRITLMLWLKPDTSAAHSMDILSKGDHHVLQITEGKKLNFFSGGWGRGECSIDLPENWQENWHHLAGVCDGKSLVLYLDGHLKAQLMIDPDISLINNSRWQLGGNKEFPGERMFKGKAKGMMIFKEALSEENIRKLMKQSW